MRKFKTLGLGLGRGRRGLGISVSINGLTGGSAFTGDHATITASMSDASSILTYKWGSTSGGSEYGTGTSPTDFTEGFPNGTLYLEVTTAAGTFNTSAAIATNDFVMTFETTGTNENFTLPMVDSGTYSATMTIDNGADIAITTFDDADLSQTIPSAGTHTLKLRGTAGGIRFENDATSAAKVRTVENLGDLSWDALTYGFDGCSGMTSFTAGNTDITGVTNTSVMFRGCAAMTTCSLAGMNFTNVTNIRQFFANCTLLETVDFEVVGQTGAKCTRMDEVFNNCPNVQNVDPSDLDITGLIQVGAFAGGGFNFLDGVNLSTSVYDETLTNFAAQLPIDTPFVIASSEGIIFDFQLSQPTMGGDVENARTVLINAGIFFEDAETTVPDTMAAPVVTATGATEITIQRGVRPFSGGLPIRRYSYRYSTDEVSWTEVIGTTDDLWESDVLGSLAADDYFVQIRAEASGSRFGAWSASTSVTVTGTVSITVEGEEDPNITGPTGNTDPLTITIDTVDYTQSVPSSLSGTAETLTIALIEANPQPLTNATPTGSTGLGDTVTGYAPIFVFAEDDPGDATFQWQSDGVDISGATSLTFDITASEQGTDLTLITSYPNYPSNGGSVTVTSPALSIPAGGSDALLLQTATDALLLEGGSDKLLLEA